MLVAAIIFINLFLAQVYSAYQSNAQELQKKQITLKHRGLRTVFREITYWTGDPGITRDVFSRVASTLCEIPDLVGNDLSHVNLFYELLDEKGVGYINLIEFFHISDLLHTSIAICDRDSFIFPYFEPTARMPFESWSYRTLRKYQLWVEDGGLERKISFVLFLNMWWLFYSTAIDP